MENIAERQTPRGLLKHLKCLVETISAQNERALATETRALPTQVGYARSSYRATVNDWLPVVNGRAAAGLWCQCRVAIMFSSASKASSSFLCLPGIRSQTDFRVVLILPA